MPSALYETQALVQGTHTFRVRSIDSAVNVSAASTTNVTISSLAQPQDGDTLSPFLPSSTSSSTTIRIVPSFTLLEMSTDAQLIVNASCGVKSALHLGAGERLGSVNSFRAAFGRMPSTKEDWNDVIKIANGRFPSQASATAEANAKIRFRAVYKRDAIMANTNDNVAVNIMAYGLRPLPRNMSSEASPVMSFKAIYKVQPTTAVEWDTVRAIAYSGATR